MVGNGPQMQHPWQCSMLVLHWCSRVSASVHAHWTQGKETHIIRTCRKWGGIYFQHVWMPSPLWGMPAQRPHSAAVQECLFSEISLVLSLLAVLCCALVLVPVGSRLCSNENRNDRKLVADGTLLNWQRGKEVHLAPLTPSEVGVALRDGEAV